MKRLLHNLSFLSIVAASFVFAGCGDSAPRVLKVGIDSDYAPWTYVDKETGKFTGFDTELAYAICDDLGWQAEFHPIAWNLKDQVLYSGEIDIVMSAFTTTGRESDYAIVGPYADNLLVVLARMDRKIESNEDLKGKIVLVQEGTTNAEMFDPGGEQDGMVPGFKRLLKGGSAAACIQFLITGVADAYVVDTDLAHDLESRFPDVLEVVNDDPLRREMIGAGLRKNDTELKRMIEGAINRLAKKGVCARLAERFLGDDSRFQWSFR